MQHSDASLRLNNDTIVVLSDVDRGQGGRVSSPVCFLGSFDRVGCLRDFPIVSRRLAEGTDPDGTEGERDIFLTGSYVRVERMEFIDRRVLPNRFYPSRGTFAGDIVHAVLARRSTLPFRDLCSCAIVMMYRVLVQDDRWISFGYERLGFFYGRLGSISFVYGCGGEGINASLGMTVVREERAFQING